MPGGLAIILLLLGPLAMAVGGIVLVLGSSRSSTKHQCLNCHYELRGLPTTVRCPECGVTLDGSNTIVPGQNITGRWRLTIGLVLTVLGLLGLAIAMFALILVLLLRE